MNAVVGSDELHRYAKRLAVLAYAALQNVGDIQPGRDAADIDVFPLEPEKSGDPFDSPLIGVPNVLLTPHIGGSTVESQENTGREVAEKLANFLKWGASQGAVNFPELSFQEPVGLSRILHMHRNVPGVLAALNAMFAAHGFNIAAQRLQTKGPMGYVVTDLDQPATAEVAEALRDIPGTLRCELC